jgi:cytochrome c peroxidase
MRGVKLFFGEKGDCFHCHGGFNFTDQSFHNTGLDPVTTDPGRIAVTERPLDDGKFKTPSLRNIALTAPYMHDGRFATLRQAIDHYNSGSQGHPNQDPLMRPLGLSEGDIGDLIAFLESLKDTAFANNPDFSNPWAL